MDTTSWLVICLNIVTELLVMITFDLLPCNSLDFHKTNNEQSAYLILAWTG